MKEAENKMGRLTRRRESITEELAGGATDHVQMAELGRELAEVEAELAATEEAWLELAEEADR